jgi:hypothetical protein
MRARLINYLANAALLIGAIFLSGCATTMNGTSTEIQQLHNVTIVRVATPPLTRNTWSGSLLKLYPSLLTAVVDSQTEKPPGLQPPTIPDFGAVLAARLNEKLVAKPLWRPVQLAIEPIATSDRRPPGNALLIELEQMTISGGGQLVAVAHFKLIEDGGKVLWETRSSYNGVFSAKGDNIDARLLKGRSAVEEEFNDAADQILQRLFERLP